MTENQAIIEAILFASGDAVHIERIASVIHVDNIEIGNILSELEQKYNDENRGIQLVRMNNKVQLCTKHKYAEQIRLITENRKPPTLGQATLEVLSIIAYRQPVTRAFIEQLRGVDSNMSVTSLVEKGLIEPAGKLDVPGKPMLFRTTDVFLRTFGISHISDLPKMPALTENIGAQMMLEE